MRTFAIRGNSWRFFHFTNIKSFTMTQEITHSILQKAIKNLDVSREFKAMAKANGFKTLQNILDMPLHELPYKQQSGYRMLKEFLHLLDEHSISVLVEENEERNERQAVLR